MNAVVTIAGLTLREAARRRLLLALAVLTIAVAALTGWGFSRLPTISVGRPPHPIAPVEARLAASQLLILVMFMFSGALALSAVFVAAPAVAGEVESGVALSILARPLRRRDIVLGKWLGLATLLTTYTVAACGLEFLVVRLAMGYTPPHPELVVLFLIAEGLTLLTLALLLSTRLPGMTGGIIAAVLFFAMWMLGVVGGLGEAYQNDTVTHIGTLSKLLLPSDGLWRGAIYGLEPASVISGVDAAGARAGANPFYASALPPTPYLVWCAAWLVAMLGLAMYSFSRRAL